MKRRDFVRNTAAASLVYSSLPLMGFQSKAKRYKTALIGSGWWGMNILTFAVASGECEVVALCDVDQNQLDIAKEILNPLTSDRPTYYEDYRELLKKENPEIVIVGTPDHWHALPAIAAMESGAHVYVEKPIGHTINEGKAMVNAARENDRVVQVGLHRKVSPHNKAGIDFLKSGKAGEIGMVRSFVHYPFRESKLVEDSNPPNGLNWDMWCGPAPYRNYNKKIHPKGFRQFLDYANGQAGDWGVHWFDQILGWTEEKYPKTVHSTGGRKIMKGIADAPDHQVINFEFESFTATWEHRQFGGNQNEKHAIGVYFYGTKGVFHMGWLDGWTFYPTNPKEETIHIEPVLHTKDQHNIPELWADFMHAIKSKTRPVADIQVGHYATNMSLLGMLSLKLGRSVAWDGEKDLIIGDEEANKLLSREYRSPWEYPKV